MLCCHKYPHKYCVFLDSCERAYFRWMIAEHKDVLLKDVFLPHTLSWGQTPFFFFLFFSWCLRLDSAAPLTWLKSLWNHMLFHPTQQSGVKLFEILFTFFFFDIPSQTNDVMPQHYSFFFFCTNVPESQSCRFSRVTLQCSTCRHMKLHHLL